MNAAAAQATLLSRRRRPGAGFTLLEILVALAVIAIALAAIVGETSQRISSAARLTDRTLAHWVAMNQITTAQLSTAWPAVGNTNDSVEMAGREWFWTLKVSSTDDASNANRRIHDSRGARPAPNDRSRP